MRDIVLKNKNGNFQELIIEYDIDSFEEEYTINDERSIKLEVPRTEINKVVYDKILPDMLLDWNEQLYTIISSDEELVEGQPIKKVESKHIFMESQFVFVEKDLTNEKVNDDFKTDDDGVIDKDDDKNPNDDVDDDIGDSNIDLIADKIKNFLRDRGMKYYQIYGILGNAKAESNMDPASEQVPNDPDRGGKGLFQWDDRKYELYNFAERNNGNWQDPDIQLQFMWHEFQTTENDAYERLKKTENVRGATLVFHRYFERSADTPEMEERRVKFANEYKQLFESISEENKNDEKYNSDWLDISKGINYGFGSGGAYESETGAQRHDGIDIDYVYDDVYSVANGIVTTGFEEGGYGNYIMIKNDSDNLTIIYAHLSEIDVSNGDEVYPGTKLGFSGNTGFSTAPHLHFELRQDGKAFDPMDWIERNSGGTSDDNDDNNGNVDSGEDDDINKNMYSLSAYLDYGFSDNKLGFTYEIIGDFNNYHEVEKIGDKNLLEHLVDGAEIFGYIYFADNKHIKIYDKGNFYEYEDEPIIYQFNSDELKVKTSIIDLETYIQGYGGKRDTKNTKNYNPITVKYLQLHGSFDKNGTWTTEKTGNSYEAEMVAKYGNETLTWNFKKGKLGGIVSVYVDDELINDLSSYSPKSKTDEIVLKRGLKKGSHKIKVEFKEKDDSVDYEDETPVMYVQSEKTDVFNMTAILNGKDVYAFYDEYTTDLYDTYSLRMAPTVYMDKAESVEELREELKNKIKSEPKVEVSTNYTNYDKIKENSKVRLVHKPMNFNTDLEVVGLKKKHPMTNEKADVEFTNNTTDILRIQRQFNKAISNMNKGD